MIRSFALLVSILIAGCNRPAHEFVEERTGLRFVLVGPGTFTMGSPEAEPGHRPDERQHQVRISRSFYISSTEVTQRQWLTVMGNNPSEFKGDDRAPVEQITLLDVEEFLRRLNAKGDGRYRLPTEAEWEFACRAGSTSVYSVGDRLSSDDANYDARYPLPGQSPRSYRARTTPVGSFKPNAWGLYDMHGNVWEWCEDEYCPYESSSAIDPVGRCGNTLRVIRGGSWYFNADSARSATRYTHEPQWKGFSIGFRVVREVENR